MREKIFVNQVQIREMLLIEKPYTVAKKLKHPISVVCRIASGKDVPYYKRKQPIDKANLCTRCHYNEKADGFRYLCLKCFHASDSVDEYRVAI